MKFERSNVVDSLCDNLKQWVNWKGVVSDNLKNLKEIVENIHSEDNVKYKVVDVDTQSNTPFMTDRGLYWQFFYPVKPPKEKEEPKLVPFDNCQEMIDWYCEHEGLSLSENQMPPIWVNLKKGYYAKGLISGFLDNGFVLIGKKCLSLKTIFDNYTLIDGTPIGKEGGR